jgi:hypothetical protein
MNRICDGVRRLAAKIGFGPGPAMTPEERNGRIAMLSASLLTLVAISCASLGLWRVGTDLEWAGDFVIQNGFLSHWQVWLGAAIGLEYASWWLTRYAATMRKREVEIASGLINEETATAVQPLPALISDVQS